MRNWQPDVAIDTESAHLFVCGQFPEFEIQEATYLGRGWDNFCLEYADGTVFRFPTRKLGAELLQLELDVLPFLCGRLPLPIPEILYRGLATDLYPYSFFGYRKLPGRTADQLAWTPAARRAAAPVLGAFLRALHAIDTCEPPFAGLPRDDLAKTGTEVLMRRIHQRNSQLLESGYGGNRLLHEALGVAEELAQQPRGVAPRICVLHGDLYPRHVLATEDLTVSGVIDWGDVRVGDAAIDLSLVYSFFEPGERAGFWEAYGLDASASDRPVMMLRAGMYGFSLMAYGVDAGDASATAMGEEILGRVVGGKSEI